MLCGRVIALQLHTLYSKSAHRAKKFTNFKRELTSYLCGSETGSSKSKMANWSLRDDQISRLAHSAVPNALFRCCYSTLPTCKSSASFVIVGPLEAFLPETACPGESYDEKREHYREWSGPPRVG